MPSPGLVRGLASGRRPGHPRRRRRACAGYTVPVFYDSMIAKLIAWARHARRGDRADGARARANTRSLGVTTTIPFFLWLMRAAGLSRRAVRHDVSRSAARGARAASRSAELDRDEEQMIACRGARRLVPRERGSRPPARRAQTAQPVLTHAARQEALARMTFEIEINGRSRTVSIERAGRQRASA